MELDMGQRSPLELKAEDPKRLANYRRGLDHMTSAKHMLGQLMLEHNGSKTCSARLSESVDSKESMPAGLRGSFQSQPRQG